MTQYQPLSSRDGKNDRDYGVLHEGVPLWMDEHLIGWVRGQLRNERDRYWYPSVKLIELDLKEPLGGDGDVLMRRCAVNELLLLDVVNWLLEHREHRSRVEEVAQILDRGGSVWKVVGSENYAAHLERRVVEELGELTKKSLAENDTARRHLARAWRQAWSLEGNPNESYSESVKAVEASLRPLVAPADEKATLGRMIGQIRANRDNYAIRLEPRSGANALDGFLGELETLWQSHRRHGEADTLADMTIDEARDGVGLAAVIVDWAQRGGFYKKV